MIVYECYENLDESWSDYTMCKLQTFPPMTDHDIWLENFFVGKIIHEDWKSDQILIDSVSYGHQKLFKTMFALARNKNPRFFEIHKSSKCICHKKFQSLACFICYLLVKFTPFL